MCLRGLLPTLYKYNATEIGRHRCVLSKYRDEREARQTLQSAYTHTHEPTIVAGSSIRLLLMIVPHHPSCPILRPAGRRRIDKQMEARIDTARSNNSIRRLGLESLPLNLGPGLTLHQSGRHSLLPKFRRDHLGPPMENARQKQRHLFRLGYALHKITVLL